MEQLTRRSSHVNVALWYSPQAVWGWVSLHAEPILHELWLLLWHAYLQVLIPEDQ